MRFALLGPVRFCSRDGESEPTAEVRGTMPRTILAALLLNANTVVSVDRLVELLWAGDPPASAQASLHNHIARLRRLLGDQAGARLVSMPPGYLFRVEPGESDLEEFTTLCARGAAALRAGEWNDASNLLAEARTLWRGEPAADVPALDRTDARIQQLVENVAEAAVGWAKAELALGRHRELIPELRGLTTRYPLREELYGHLMLALYRSERQAEALEVYQQLRRTLVDELSLEPSTPLRLLHQRILARDSALAAPASGERPRVGGHGARFNLPPDTAAFTGRERELAELYEFEDAARRLGSGAAAVVAIDGMAGIGKTALALHAAHRMAERFPDGRMFLDLRGHSPGLTPLDPAEALDYFLRCLGVPPQLIPPDPQARSAFYRDRLTGTRTLIVLDNALGDAQVRPLLPPDPGCLVLVTSRRRLLGLDDAYTLGLDPFAASEAVELLRRVAGPEPLAAAAPDVAGELAELCGHMPLALRIAGSRLRGRRAAGLDELVLRLRDESSRLARLHDSDRSLISVFESSYAVLSEDEQLLLRRLGLAPGPEVDAYAAAALLDSDLGAAGSLLESLVDHNLVMQQAAGRYRLHDLVRFFAQRCAGADDAPSNEAALARLLDYYQQAAWRADARIARYQAPGSQHTAEVGTTSPALPELIDQPSAIAWMRDERANLLAARDLAAARGEDARVTALAGACAAYLQQEGPWPLAEALQESAAQAAVRAGDPAARAAALAALGRLRRVAGDYPSASGLLEQVLLIYQGVDDELGEANARCDLGLVHYLTNERKPAIAEFEEALAYYRSSGDLRGEGAALQGLGRVRQAVGEYALAAPLHERAAEVYAVLGDRIGEANALWDLARVDYAYGECASAVRRLERAQEIHRASGDRLGEANVLCDLSRVLGTQGTYPEAVAAGAASVEVFRALGNRVGEANALVALGRVRILLCEHEAAREALTRALHTFRDLDDRFGESQALHALGAVGRALGDHAGATDLLRQAEAISWATGDQHSMANIELELGRVCHATADFDEAAEHFALAVAGFRAVGDPQGEAEALNSTAALVYDVDGPQPARECFQQALECARAAHSPVDEAAAEAGIARCRAAARGTATGPDDLP